MQRERSERGHGASGDAEARDVRSAEGKVPGGTDVGPIGRRPGRAVSVRQRREAEGNRNVRPHQEQTMRSDTVQRLAMPLPGNRQPVILAYHVMNKRDGMAIEDGRHIDTPFDQLLYEGLIMGGTGGRPAAVSDLRIERFNK